MQKKVLQSIVHLSDMWPPMYQICLACIFLMLAQFVFVPCFVEGWTCPQGSSQYFLMNRKNVADIANASEGFKKKKPTIIIRVGTKVSDIDRRQCNCFSPSEFFRHPLSCNSFLAESGSEVKNDGSLYHSWGFTGTPCQIYFLWLTLSYSVDRTSNTDRLGVSLSPTMKTANVRAGLDRQGNPLQYRRELNEGQRCFLHMLCFRDGIFPLVSTSHHQDWKGRKFLSRT